MNLALQIGDSLIPCDRVLQQLSEAQLLPQLLREMVIDDLIDRVAREHQIDLTPTPAEFDKLTEQVAGITPFRGMNSAQIEAITYRTLKLHKFKQAGWGHKVSSYYQTIQQKLYRVSYSILQVEDGLLAQELFFRIQSGEQSFAELAIKYSHDPSAKKGGLIGPIFSREILATHGQILQQLAPGELSSLFRLDGCYGFIRLNDVIPPQLDENMHQILLDELFESWIQAQIATEVDPDRATVIAPITSIVQQPPTEIPIVDIFAPDFTYHPEIATAPPQSPDVPEVTVVTEPAQTDLEISTGFFFPNRQKNTSVPTSNLTSATTPSASAASDNSAFTLPPDLEVTTPPIVQAQNRSRQLVIGIAIIATITLTAIGANRYLAQSNNPPQFGKPHTD